MIFLIEQVLPQGYFDQSLRALSVDMAVLRSLLHQRLPKTARHLDELQRNSGVFLISLAYSCYPKDLYGLTYRCSYSFLWLNFSNLCSDDLSGSSVRKAENGISLSFPTFFFEKNCARKLAPERVLWVASNASQKWCIAHLADVCGNFYTVKHCKRKQHIMI